MANLRGQLKTIHTWIGIVSGVFLSVVALTGSVIVFRGEFERAALPHRSAPALARQAGLDEAAREIARVRPDSHVRRVRIPAAPGDPYIFQVQSEGKKTERLVADSSTGQVLGTVESGWVDWMVDLHRNLLSGATGRSIVGAIGIILFVLSATGLIMWLTGARSWRAWTSVRLGSTTRFHYELHRASGLWSYAFLALISFTGIELVYPQTFRQAVQSLTGKPATVAAPKKIQAEVQLPLDEYMRIGRAAMADGVATELRLPEQGKGPVDLRFYRAGDLSPSGNHVYLNSATGAVISVDRIVDRPIGARFLAAFSPIHYAQFGGVPVKIAWALFGTAPLLLFVTGLYAWRRPKARPGQKTAKEAGAKISRWQAATEPIGRTIMRYVCLLAILVCPLSAQTDRATLTGVVMDPSRSVIAAAKVSVHAAATGLDYATLTNSAGVYTFTGLPVGGYTASIAAPGFDVLQIQTFALEVGETRTLNATLRVGGVTSAVTVVEAAPDLDLATSEVGGVIQGKQTNALPVNGRYWASLMALIPGAISSGTGTQDAIRFAGTSQEDNNFRFDGVDATGLNHQFVKEPARLQFPLESIAEFKASAAVYSADIGGMAGGQVSMVSKGGGNELHGSAYEYLRNSFFDSKAFDSPSVAPFRLNNFGASLGGPVVRNKLFFFSNYESLRQVYAQQVSGFVPTDAYRAQVAQKSPALAPLINAYPTGSIPTADPNALLWISGGRNPTSEDAGLFRIDYAMTSATTINLRFNTDAYRTVSPALAENTYTTMDPPNAVLDVQHIFSPTILNDARIGFNRDNYVDVGDGKTPYSLSITGFAGYSLGDHSSRIDNSYSFVDNATFSHGRHTIKAGVEIRRMQENKLHPNALQSLSYLKEADFVNNLLDSYSYSAPGVETQARKNPYYGYILDEFKIRPNLTLNAGLRYEYYGVDYDKNNVGLVFDPYTCGLQYCPPGTSFYYPNTHDFGPRVSIAWAPETFHGKTAIRAGGGIFYSDGQFGGLYAAQTNIGQNFSLTQKNIPGLTFPITPFLGAAAFSVSYSGKDRRRKDIAVDEWNISIQQEIARDTILQVGYLGTKGTHLFRKGLSLNGIDPVTGKRPYASLTNSTIGWTTDDANSNLQALQVSLRRNLRTGLLVSANYQWSHGISDGSNGDGESDTPQNMNCRSCERGNTDFDVRHNFTSSAVWILPVGKGQRFLGSAPTLVNSLLGGWQLSGIGTARTGLPLNPTLSRSASALPDGINGSQRPDVVPGQPLYPADQNPTLWLNPFAFTTPANGKWGNAGRNILRGPGIWAADVSLEKRFTVRERMAVSFRADVFNVFNRAQIGNPSVKWTDPTQGTTFGAITSPYTTSAVGTGTPRQMQFMLRLSF